MTAGFIGLGKMGGPMAANVVKSAPGLVCFDMAGTEARMPAGAVAADSIGDVASRCETLFISVPDGAATLAVAKEILSTGNSVVATTPWNNPGPLSIPAPGDTRGPPGPEPSKVKV